VVRDKVEYQLQSALLQPLSQPSQRRRAAQIAMDGVFLDGETGAGDVFVAQVRQRFLKLLAPFGAAARNLLRRHAGLPDAQQPDPVAAHFRQGVQLLVRYVVERRRPTERLRQLGQPSARVDLIERG
jgi:hypothetical protein